MKTTRRQVATLEAGTPMYFGIYEAQENLLFDAYRIRSENADAIGACLIEKKVSEGLMRIMNWADLDQKPFLAISRQENRKTNSRI